MNFQHYLLTFFIAFFFGCNTATEKAIEPNIIPKPLSQKINDGFFILDISTAIETYGEFKNVANYLNSFLTENYNLKLQYGRLKLFLDFNSK